LGCGDFGEDALACGFGFGPIAAGEDDGCSGAGEFEGGVEADAAVGSGDPGELALLRGDLDGGPVGHGVVLSSLAGEEELIFSAWSSCSLPRIRSFSVA
jgi:hypothetical protein